MRRVNVPGCPISLRPADAAVYYAVMGYPPRSIVKLMRGSITHACVRQAISQARARGEAIPDFKSVPNVLGRLSRVWVSSKLSGHDAGECAGQR